MLSNLKQVSKGNQGTEGLGESVTFGTWRYIDTETEHRELSDCQHQCRRKSVEEKQKLCLEELLNKAPYET
jgi:hypothetical protein